MLWVFPQWLQCPPGSGLLVSPPSTFSRVKSYWILGWASFPPSPGGPTSLHCICLSQGVDVLLMQIHGTVEWINDPTSNSTHPWTLPRLRYERYPQSFHCLLHLFIFCFVPQVPPWALSAALPILLFLEPVLEMNLTLLWLPSGFSLPLSSLTPQFLAYSLSQIPKFPPAADPLPADLSIIELVVLLWPSSLPRTASSLSPFLPRGPWTGLFFSRAGPDCRLISAGDGFFPLLPVLFVEP